MSYGKTFVLVRQGYVTYSPIYNRGTHCYEMQRQVRGESAVEIYDLGTQ
ncbi:hypothetical protein IAD21_06435 (plasmid) [Abditibacteriota bacterium]|nr:hypothetical protein IAD21_06435 [Abditibacteriota bacterium]